MPNLHALMLSHDQTTSYQDLPELQRSQSIQDPQSQQWLKPSMELCQRFSAARTLLRVASLATQNYLIVPRVPIVPRVHGVPPSIKSNQSMDIPPELFPCFATQKLPECPDYQGELRQRFSAARTLQCVGAFPTQVNSVHRVQVLRVYSGMGRWSSDKLGSV
jgi:hypothetical protein